MTRRVVMLSFWRNDAERGIKDRMRHLLSKWPRYQKLRWVWVVGDSQDSTEKELRWMATSDSRITVKRHDTCVEGDDHDTRILRLSLTANAGLDAVRITDDVVVIHESDLRSPVNVVERLLDLNHLPAAGWPVLRMGDREVFYDTWAYRAQGKRFTNGPPYHAVARPGRPFYVDSVGSCWAFPAAPIIAGVRCDRLACLDICAGLASHGYGPCVVDPTLRIEQPGKLWECHVPSEATAS